MAVRQPHVVFLLFIVICGSLHCTWHQSVGASEHPSALILHPRARDVKFSEVKGATQLTYEVDAKFPASGVIGEISYELEERGWEALTHDFLDPDLCSSQVQGWTQFRDARKTPLQYVHQWIGDWQDSSGNIARYVFHYRSPKDYASNLTNLEVTATYIPALLVKQDQDAIKKFKEKRPTK
jgi:hypothetical protein